MNHKEYDKACFFDQATGWEKVSGYRRMSLMRGSIVGFGIILDILGGNLTL